MPAVLSDVDGTLVDTTYLHTVCWWQSLSEAGHRVPMVAVSAPIGMGADQLLPRLLRREPGPDLAASLKDRHDQLFRAYWDRLQPTPGAAAFVRACARRGLRVVLVTSAAQDELGALRRALDADDAITAATTAQDVTASKPAPDMVERGLRLAGVPGQDAVFVGDTVWDICAARAAGVRCVALTCGGTGEHELRQAGALAVYRDPAQLLDDFAASPLSRL